MPFWNRSAGHQLESLSRTIRYDLGTQIDPNVVGHPSRPRASAVQSLALTLHSIANRFHSLND